MILKILRNAYENKKIISLTPRDFDWEDSILGYVTKINDDNVIINEINEYGKSIGNIVIKISNIRYLKLDSWEIRNRQLIYDKSQFFSPESRISIWKDGKELVPYLRKLKENKEISKLYFDNDNSETGIVLEVDDDSCLFKSINENGEQEDISCYFIKNIIGLKYGDIEMQMLKLLYENSCPK